MAADDTNLPPARDVPIGDLKPHPRNYKVHPDSQLEHIMQSIREYGFVRNIVAARDLTILVGHGATEAARRLEMKFVPVVVLDLDPDDPAAEKLLALENELGRFAERDDRLFTEIMRDVSQTVGIFGTGYDEAMLANLAMITRTEDEFADFDAAAEWVGLPEFQQGAPSLKFIVQFDTEEDRAKFIEETGINISHRNRQTWSGWWPPRERDDSKSVVFVDADD